MMSSDSESSQMSSDSESSKMSSDSESSKMSSDSESSQPPDSPKPKRLKTLASLVKFPGGNLLLHWLILENSRPNNTGNMNAVLRSMSDAPASAVNALNDDGYSALQLAVIVSKDDPMMVKNLLFYLVHVDVNAQCGDGNTALHLATKLRYSSIVRELLDKGASIAIMNRFDETALSVAMKLGALDLVRILVSANVNEHILKNTPLHEAAYYGSSEIAEFLIGEGADIEGRDVFQRTPLHVVAAERGDLDMAKLLICNRADINARDGIGSTPLRRALHEGYFEIAEYLIDQGAVVDVIDYYERTPLNFEAWWGNLDSVKFLIEKGADLHAKGVDGRTPLHAALNAGNLEISAFLIDQGADVNCTDLHGRTPLHNTAEGCMHGRVPAWVSWVLHDRTPRHNTGNLDIAKFLIDKGANLHALDEDGRTPLRSALHKENLEMAAFLIDQGADVDDKDVRRRTPLHNAAEGGNLDIVKFLIGQGADLHAIDEDGRTPLHAAVSTNQLECASFLLNQGAHLHAVDQLGWTPLHGAAYEDCVDVVRALLERGADVCTKNGDRKTALDLARENGNQLCIDVLENVYNARGFYILLRNIERLLQKNQN